MPELLDPSSPETSCHNYRAVNDGLDISDHSPVFATFTLQVRAVGRVRECSVRLGTEEGVGVPVYLTKPSVVFVVQSTAARSLRVADLC
jgi:hypothetical protein